MSIRLLSISLISVCLLVIAQPVVSAGALDANPLSLNNAIRKALNDNPNLAAINARFLAISQTPSQLGALPEPKLKFNVANLPLDSFALDQTAMTQIQMGITQALPFPGKLALKSEIAQNLANASAESLQDAKLKLVQQVRHQWWQLFYLDRAIEVVKKNQIILKQFVEVAETKYSVGQGLQQDILLAQVEEYRLQDKELQLLSTRHTVQSRLNMLMGAKRTQVITINPNVDEVLPELNKPAEYLPMAKAARPDIKKAKSLTDAAKSKLDLAKKDYYPDFQLGAVYGWRKDRTGLGSVQFSMNIPWDTANRQDPAKDQRNYEWMQTKYAVTDLENRILEEIEVTVANYERAKKQLILFKDAIIPQAEQTVEAMLAGYQVNKVDFLNLLGAQITLFNYNTQYWRALSAANQYLAALDTAIGKELDQETSHE